MDEAYFREVVDPQLRPLMLALKDMKPSKDELASFVANFLNKPVAETVITEDERVVKETIEMDTEAAEDEIELATLLLPPHMSPLTKFDGVVDKFSICYSKRALEGWVKQPSPCCAAASAAGAWNIVAGVQRNDPSAQSHLTLVPRFIGILRDQVGTVC